MNSIATQTVACSRTETLNRNDFTFAIKQNMFKQNI